MEESSTDTPKTAPVLLLALGNDLLGDDGIALAAARALRGCFDDSFLAIEESSEAGLRLMEILTGYERAILIDSVQTKQCPPGTLLEFGVDDFRKVIAPSPHYAGIPEVLSMAERLGIPFPTELKVLAVEVENPYDFQESFTPAVDAALPEFVTKVREILEQWQEELSPTREPTEPRELEYA